MAKSATKKTEKKPAKAAAKKGPRKESPTSIRNPKEPSVSEVLDILRLPDTESGREKLDKMMSAFDERFTTKQRLFVLFYTAPMSRTCGRIGPSGSAAGGSWNSWGDWAINQPHIREKINEIASKASLQAIEDIFREDIEYNRQVLLCDRTEFKKDNHIELEDKGIEFDSMDDKKISELTPTQRKMVAGFDYDRNGRPHYAIETRQSARQALLTYHKMLTSKVCGGEEKKTETVVTLEGIRDKATAKISIIQKNNEEAKAAGEFIDTMADLDEEA